MTPQILLIRAIFYLRTGGSRLIPWIRGFGWRKVAIGTTVAALVLAGTWFFFDARRDSREDTLLVRAGSFIQQVSLSGTVVAAEEVDLGFTESGRIARVHVKVGDVVPAGKVLASIEDGDLRAAVLQREAALEAEEARLRSLEEGTRPEELAVAEAEVESASAALAQKDQSVIDAIQSAYSTVDDAIHNQLDQFITNPRTENPQVEFLSVNSQAISKLEMDRRVFEMMSSTWQREIASLSSAYPGDLAGAIEKAQRNLSETSSILALAATILNGAIPSSSDSQSDINGYIFDIATARAAINTQVSSLTSAATARASASATLNTARKNLALKRAGATTADIDVQKAQVKSARALLEDARARAQKALIIAPFAGIVTRVDATPGEIVSPNTSEISMISSGGLEVESFVPEINLPLLSVGNRAGITLDAYGTEVLFTANLVSIDPAQTVRDGVSTYRAILEFDRTDSRIRAGMTANVTITTEERDGVISVPRDLIVGREGKKFLRVKEGEGVVEREVTTGSISSLGSVEITSGLKEGDVVLLSEN